MTNGEVFNKKSKCTLAIIPCYNEEHTIGSVVLKTKHYVDEVLVVDDGSTDDTAKVAEYAGATVIAHKVNRGKRTAIKTGFRYALECNFDYLVTVDGDGQHDPDEIPAILEHLVNDGGDINISTGIRPGDDAEMPLWRKIGKKTLDYSTSFGNGGFVTDSQCGFRVFTKKAVKELTPRLKCDAFSVESEQLLRAHELNLGVSHTHVSCKYKDLNTSTKDSPSHGFSVLNYVIWLVAEKRPLLFIGVPGFVSVIFGLFFGILTMQYYNQAHVFSIPYAILVSIFLIIGALAIFIGLMLNVLPGIIKKAKE